MKRKWILQLAGFIAAMLLFIFTVNTCAAQKESYSIVGMGCSINEMPMLIPVTTTAVFTIDEETDIVGVEVNEKIAYKYLLTGALSADDKPDWKEATFSAIDPENHKYFINMRMYDSGEIQITIGDKDARAALVFFIQTQAVDGLTTAR